MNTLKQEREAIVEFLFSGENEFGKFVHQGIGNCTVENVRQALLSHEEKVVAGVIDLLGVECDEKVAYTTGLLTPQGTPTRIFSEPTKFAEMWNYVRKMMIKKIKAITLPITDEKV